MKSGKNENSAGVALRRYANLGIEMVVAVLLGTWGGNKLDQWLDTTPWLLLLGFLFGAAAGFLNIMRLILSGQKRKKAE